jgi:hypothetical protein
MTFGFPNLCLLCSWFWMLFRDSVKVRSGISNKTLFVTWLYPTLSTSFAVLRSLLRGRRTAKLPGEVRYNSDSMLFFWLHLWNIFGDFRTAILRVKVNYLESSLHLLLKLIFVRAAFWLYNTHKSQSLSSIAPIIFCVPFTWQNFGSAW